MLSSHDDTNPYLQQEVMSASPPRLRWLLIQRACELCELVKHLWASDEPHQADQWLLRIREILSELIEGVKDRDNPLSKTITDFYIFIIQTVAQVERDRDSGKLEIIRDLLAIELETWRQVIESGGEAGEFQSEAELQTASRPTAKPLPIPTNAAYPDLSAAGGFSLEV